MIESVESGVFRVKEGVQSAVDTSTNAGKAAFQAGSAALADQWDGFKKGAAEKYRQFSEKYNELGGIRGIGGKVGKVAGEVITAPLWGPKYLYDNREKIGEKIGGAVDKVKEKVGNMWTSIKSFGSFIAAKVGDLGNAIKTNVTKYIGDKVQAIKDEIEASRVNRQNKRDLEVFRSEMKDLEKTAVRTGILNDRIGKRDEVIKGSEEAFKKSSEDALTKAEAYKAALNKKTNLDKELNQLKLDKVEVKSLLGDIKRVDDKINRLGLTDEQVQKFNSTGKFKDQEFKAKDDKEQKLFDKYSKLRSERTNIENRLDGRDVNSVNEAIANKKAEIGKEKDGVNKEISAARKALVEQLTKDGKGSLKANYEVNQYASAIEKKADLEQKLDGRAAEGARHFDKAARAAGKEDARNMGELAKAAEAKKEQIEKYDEKYNKGFLNKVKNAVVIASGASLVDRLRNDGVAAVAGDAWGAITGGAGEKARQDGIDRANKLAKIGDSAKEAKANVKEGAFKFSPAVLNAEKLGRESQGIDTILNKVGQNVDERANRAAFAANVQSQPNVEPSAPEAPSQPAQESQASVVSTKTDVPRAPMSEHHKETTEKLSVSDNLPGSSVGSTAKSSADATLPPEVVSAAAALGAKNFPADAKAQDVSTQGSVNPPGPPAAAQPITSETIKK